MTINECPKCNKTSLVKAPLGRVMRRSLGSELHVADEYKMICLSDGCGYKSDKIRINTKLGKKLSKPWWKRIFS